MDKIKVRSMSKLNLYRVSLGANYTFLSHGRVKRAGTLFDALEEKRIEVLRMNDNSGCDRYVDEVDILASMQARLC